jgi:cbb3-type cytochrome oxidase maturation protein
MTVLLYLMPAALFLGLLGLAGFLWALKSGQFDDLDGAAHRILIDEEPAASSPVVSPAATPRRPAP